MKSRIGKIGLAAVAGTSLVVAPAIAVAESSDGRVPDSSQTETADIAEESGRVVLDKVEGVFSFNQTDVSSNEEIARALNRSAKYLCGSAFSELAAQNAGEDSACCTVSVRGAVQNEFTASLEALADEGSANIVMGCSCAGNPAGGLATANADTNGIRIAYIAEKAGVSGDANTIVFTSSDGYEVALPLDYVNQRYSMIVYEINGCDLSDTVGGTNQLWLGSTSGQYFVRDVEAITFESRETPPPNPYTEAGDAYYGNFPGVGVTSAG